MTGGLVMKSSLVEIPFLGTLIEWQFMPKQIYDH